MLADQKHFGLKLERRIKIKSQLKEYSKKNNKEEIQLFKELI